MIATSQGRKPYGRAKAVEAERGIRTHTWDNIKEDFIPKISQEENDEEHDDSLNLADAYDPPSCTQQLKCNILNNAIQQVLDTNERRKVCESLSFCECISEDFFRNDCDNCSYLPLVY